MAGPRTSERPGCYPFAGPLCFATVDPPNRPDRERTVDTSESLFREKRRRSRFSRDRLVKLAVMLILLADLLAIAYLALT